jgi:RES domain-containing protein
MTQAWRITKAKHAPNAFDGEGARLYGGRWSNPGRCVVHVAESLSLATLEILVHLQQTAVLKEYVVFTIDFPPECVQILPERDLPENWRAYPAPAQTRAIGDRWIRHSESLILRVPSVIVTQEHNFLVNPAHPDVHRILLEGPFPLDIDPRVLKR